MWKLIKKILDLIIWFVTGKAKQEETEQQDLDKLDQQLFQDLEDIKHDHDDEVSKLPTGDSDGSSMVDYWHNRGKLPTKDQT